jgi:hypothetical protein
MMLPLMIAFVLAGMAIDREPQAFVQMINSPRIFGSAGKPANALLMFRVREGFHVNSNVPRSSYLIPTKLELKTPPEISVVKIAYSPGEDFVFAFSPDEKLNVYSGEFSISADLKFANTLKKGEHKIHGELTYQACNDRACFPPKKLPVTIDVQVSMGFRVKPPKEPAPIDPTRG